MNALLFDIVRHQSSCARNWHFVAVRRRLVIERLRREQFRPRMTTFTQEEPKLVTLSAPLLLDAPPESDQLTEYDRAHFTMYLFLRDWSAGGGDWRKAAEQIFGEEIAIDLFRAKKDHCHIAAANNANATFIQYLKDNPVPIEPGSSVGRATFERKTFHIEDVLTLPGYTRSASQEVGGQRTVLSVPLLRDRQAVGVIALMRSRVEGFTERQIKLVETFADQAVIAIENTRLFEGVQA